MPNQISLFRHHIHPEAMDNVQEVLKSGWTGLGPKTEEFEKKFCEYIGGNKYAVAVNSGTSALQLAMELSPIKPGDTVIASPITFVGANHVIKQYSCEVAFIDIEMDGNISLYELADYVSKLRSDGRKVTGVMATHYGGNPINLMKLYNIAEELDLAVIEDCAHACGATYNGVSTEFVPVKIGGYKHTQLAAFSFHSVKNLAIGDGGMLVLANEELAHKAKKLRWFGIDKSTAERSKEGYSWDYNVTEFGYKWHMNDIAAAIGLGQLLHLDADNMYRQALVDLYHHHLRDMVEIFFPIERSAYKNSSNHLIPALTFRRDELITYLKSHNIQTGVHYKPTHFYPIYADSPSSQMDMLNEPCGKARRFYQAEISLPLHVELTEKDVEYVCNNIRDFFDGRKIDG